MTTSLPSFLCGKKEREGCDYTSLPLSIYIEKKKEENNENKQL
jgi:hypothetical protein